MSVSSTGRRFSGFYASVAIAVSCSIAPVAAVALSNDSTFQEIMSSIAEEGSISNGDGHQWRFAERSGGEWEVKGARGKRASVSDAGQGKIEIDGFPSNWGANGVFLFSVSDGECQLESDHSRHRLEWDC